MMARYGNEEIIKNTENKTETHVYYYAGTEQPFTVRQYSVTDDNGLIETGDYKQFHRNGRLAVTGGHNDKGQSSGEWQSYFSNGKLSRTENYKNGLLHGDYVSYFQNGNVCEKGEYDSEKPNYSNSMRVGSFIRNYESGRRQDEFLYEYDDNNVQTVQAKSFHENGRVEKMFTLIAGGMEGRYIAFFDNGQPREFADYKAGRQITPVRRFTPSGEELAPMVEVCSNRIVSQYTEAGLRKAVTENLYFIRDDLEINHRSDVRTSEDVNRYISEKFAPMPTL